MKLAFILLVISPIVLTIAIDDQLKNQYIKLYNDWIKMVCASQLTDDQTGKVIANCEYNKDRIDPILKKCYKKETLTDRERINGWCDSTIMQCVDQNIKMNVSTAEMRVDNAMVSDEIKKLTALANCFKKQTGGRA